MGSSQIATKLVYHLRRRSAPRVGTSKTGRIEGNSTLNVLLVAGVLNRLTVDVYIAVRPAGHGDGLEKGRGAAVPSF